MAMENPLLTAIKSGAAPKMVKVAVAKGSLPLPPEVLYIIQILLTGDSDQEVKQTAMTGLRGYTPEEVVAILDHQELPPSVLDFSANFYIQKSAILEKIILHSRTPVKTFVAIAPVISPSLADLLINNQMLLIESPEIIEALRRNLNLSPGARKRLDEIENDFLRDGPSPTTTPIQSSAPTASPPSVGEEISGTIDLTTALSTDTIEESASDEPVAEADDSEEDMSALLDATDSDVITGVYEKIANLSVNEKIKLALLGRREERAILIRDPNRLVATTVLSSPKVTEKDIQVYSQMRNVNEEVLRIIGSRREWLKNQRIAVNLVKNPKTPVQVSLPLMNRLTTHDLRLLVKDRNIPEAIRRNATRMVAGRQH